MKSKFEYTLVDPIELAKDGEQTICEDVVVRCPRPKDKMDALVFESYLAKALFNISGQSNSDTAEEAAGASEDEALRGLEMLFVAHSDPENLKKMILVLRELLCEGNNEAPQATIGGVKFTKPLFDELGHRDVKALLARYAYHFLFSGSILGQSQ